MTTSIASAPRRAPGPRGHHLVGNLPEIRDDPLGVFLDGARQFGDVVRFTAGPVTIHLVAHPDGVKHVLQEANHNFGRHTRGYDVFKEVIGDGMLSTDGDFWRRQRRIAQPAFHKQRIAGFATIMRDAAAELGDRCLAYAARAEPFDLTAELLRTTLRILGYSLFSLDFTGEAKAIGAALEVLLHRTSEHARSPFHLPDIIPTPANRRFKEALATLDRLVFEMIDQRRRATTRPDDLLTMLLEARDEETGEGMDDQQLRDELVGLILAGHETTAMTLSWTLYLLSLHPSQRRRLEVELADVLAGRAPSLEELPKLPFTKAVLDEAMRLFPPAWMVPRSVTTDDEVAGYRLPAGSVVVVSPWVTHRDRRLWDNPEGFDPDRFLDAVAARERPRYAYFPFGGGPHQCIGMGFALMEAQLVLASLSQRARLNLVPGHPVEPEPLVTLRPKHGVMVTAHAR